MYQDKISFFEMIELRINTLVKLKSDEFLD
jgi:hypothetical protein